MATQTKIDYTRDPRLIVTPYSVETKDPDQALQTAADYIRDHPDFFLGKTQVTPLTKDIIELLPLPPPANSSMLFPVQFPLFRVDFQICQKKPR
jgi:hypothetical protein